MLQNVNPLLTGQLLLWLDEMGHGDAVVIADAQFPAYRLCRRVIDLPGSRSPEALDAIRSVLPLDDDAPGLDLMSTPDGNLLPVQQELVAAADIADQVPRLLMKPDFFAVAGEAYCIIRTGEQRIYGHAIFRKGIVTREP